MSWKKKKQQSNMIIHPLNLYPNWVMSETNTRATASSGHGKSICLPRAVLREKSNTESGRKLRLGLDWKETWDQSQAQLEWWHRAGPSTSCLSHSPVCVSRKQASRRIHKDYKNCSHNRTTNEKGAQLQLSAQLRALSSVPELTTMAFFLLACELLGSRLLQKGLSDFVSGFAFEQRFLP